MIKINNVTKKIKSNVILQDVTLELKEGKIYGFVGKNGSGKSMLLKTIAGFISPDKGSIVADGKKLYDEKIFLPSTRVMIDKPHFFENLSGKENLELLASIQNTITDADIENVLLKIKLADVKDKKYKTYSLGMKQKLAIAQVIMEDVKNLILDEPFNSLDMESVDLVRKILLEERSKDKIIIITSHIKEDIEMLCDEVFYIESGKIKN
ncbi:MAG: ATP-binding cassette domain-containing protein [Clostridia bacterium]